MLNNMKKLFPILYLFLLVFVYPMSAQQGLKGEYYSGKDFNSKVLNRMDAQIDFDWPMGTAPAKDINPGLYSIRWTGRLQAPVSGTYTFSAKVDDGIRLWIGNVKILDAWGMHDSENFSGKVSLDAGKKYDIKIEYFNGLREGEIHLLWETPDDKALLYGHKYKPVGNQFFSQPPASQPVVQTPPLSIKPKITAQKPIEKPKTEVAKTQTANPLNLDTVTKYIPKNVLFEKSKPTMLPQSYTELDNIAAMLKRNPSKKVLVEGHTDNVGDAALNRKLSEERAKTVVDYLVQKGIAIGRLTYQGFGGTRPITTEDTDEGHAKNRRVAFIIK
jgi:outer membrane protein OmpA-like peptidoglycan-associated protein